jgi:hypothetical protein
MSSKAGSSKRAAEDITNQAKKIKGIDVRHTAPVMTHMCLACRVPAARVPPTVPFYSLENNRHHQSIQQATDKNEFFHLFEVV